MGVGHFLQVSRWRRVFWCAAILWLGASLLSGCRTITDDAASVPSASQSTPASDLVTPAFVESAVSRYDQILSDHGHHAEVNGVDLHYLEWGDECGLPLVWLHGYTSTAFEMANVAERLVEDGYRVIAVTYRGHGLTQVESYDFSTSTIADDVAALMDHLGLEHAVVGGWSLGASITAAFYANYPDRVIALVLEDGGIVWPQLLNARSAATDRDTPFAPSISAPDVPTPSRSQIEALAKIVNWRGSSSGESLDDVGALLVSFVREDEDGHWLFHVDHKRMFGSWALVDDPFAVDQLPLFARSFLTQLPQVVFRNLDVPVLLIDPTGDDEQVFRARAADNEALVRAHPRWIHRVEYPDTPHNAHETRPDWFLRDMQRLRDWIAEADSDDDRAEFP